MPGAVERTVALEKKKKKKKKREAFKVIYTKLFTTGVAQFSVPRHEQNPLQNVNPNQMKDLRALRLRFTFFIPSSSFLAMSLKCTRFFSMRRTSSLGTDTEKDINCKITQLSTSGAAAAAATDPEKPAGALQRLEPKFGDFPCGLSAFKGSG
ncbi:uncharacterized protein V6R79_012238 [Siganus canaliculatus]